MVLAQPRLRRAPRPAWSSTVCVTRLLQCYDTAALHLSFVVAPTPQLISRASVDAGVVEHVGTFDGGHYVAYVRNDSRWYRMNDSVVTQVREAEVFAAQAFMLFYQSAQEAE